MFAEIKAYEFELETRSSEEPTSIHPTKALAVTISDPVPEKTVEQISKDVMSLFIRKFSKFMKSHSTYLNPSMNIIKESSSGDMTCFKC